MGVNSQISDVTRTLLHLNVCEKISFDTSVKWIVEEFDLSHYKASL